MATEFQTTFDDIGVHYWRGGSGFPILMLHGSGPGASTQGNWHLVLDGLAERYEILAVDLIGFGSSGRKPEEPYFDLDLWLAQSRAMLDLLPGSEFGVIGQSLSGMLALRLAAVDDRIRKVLTTDAMGARFQVNEHLRRGWTLPETREDLRRAGESLVHNSSIITEDYLDRRMAALKADGYAPYFRAMFAGDKQRFVDETVLSPDEIHRIRAEVVMIHGRDDRPVPLEATSLPLSRAILQADLVALANCGHSPALEHPEKFLAIARMLFG